MLPARLHCRLSPENGRFSPWLSPALSSAFGCYFRDGFAAGSAGIPAGRFLRAFPAARTVFGSLRSRFSHLPGHRLNWSRGRELLFILFSFFGSRRVPKVNRRCSPAGTLAAPKAFDHPAGIDARFWRRNFGDGAFPFRADFVAIVAGAIHAFFREFGWRHRRVFGEVALAREQ